MKIKRIDIPRKTRIVDTQAESNDKQIYAVEIADDFFTLFCKDSVAAFWNRGEGHDPTRYHCEVEANLWIDQQFPGKSSAGWSQHIHINCKPTAGDLEEFEPHMSGVLSDAVKQYFEE